MDGLSRSFRLQRSNSSCLSSRIVGRSQSSRLVIESVSAECMAIAGYERLSQSMRFFDEERKQQKSRAWRFLSRAFSRKDVEDDEINVKIEDVKKGKEEKTKKKRKKRSSWLPDPERRWPVQGG